MPPIRIAVLDGYTLNPGDNPWTLVEKLGEVAVYDRTPPEQVIERAKGATVLVINKVKLPANVLEQLPELKFIAVTATGFDCVDAAAARKLGIGVANVPEYGSDTVAQHTFALILHICQRTDLHTAAVKAGAWTNQPDFSFWQTQLIELAGLTLGLIGLGKIGGRVAEIAHAFGMNVIAHSRSRRGGPSWQPFAWVELDELFAKADVISMHCPLTPENKGLINASTIAKMKPSAMLINTSRGALVNEQDLADALNAGRIAAAGLDVLSVEPPPASNPLLSAKNCFITPHQAWATLAARQRLMQTTADNIAAFTAGKPIHLVN